MSPGQIILKITNPASHSPYTAYGIEEGKDVRIGRSNVCQIVIVNPYVSREHLHITWSGDIPLIEDLRSRNGTKLNGAALKQKSALSIGDVVEISGVMITVVSKADLAQSTIHDILSISPIGAMDGPIEGSEELQSKLFMLNAAQGDEPPHGRTRRTTLPNVRVMLAEKWAKPALAIAALLVTSAALYLFMSQ